MPIPAKTPLRARQKRFNHADLSFNFIALRTKTLNHRHFIGRALTNIKGGASICSNHVKTVLLTILISDC